MTRTSSLVDPVQFTQEVPGAVREGRAYGATAQLVAGVEAMLRMFNLHGEDAQPSAHQAVAAVQARAENHVAVASDLPVQTIAAATETQHAVWAAPSDGEGYESMLVSLLMAKLPVPPPVVAARPTPETQEPRVDALVEVPASHLATLLLAAARPAADPGDANERGLLDSSVPPAAPSSSMASGPRAGGMDSGGASCDAPPCAPPGTPPGGAPRPTMVIVPGIRPVNLGDVGAAKSAHIRPLVELTNQRPGAPPRLVVLGRQAHAAPALANTMPEDAAWPWEEKPTLSQVLATLRVTDLTGGRLREVAAQLQDLIVDMIVAGGPAGARVEAYFAATHLHGAGGHWVARLYQRVFELRALRARRAEDVWEEGPEPRRAATRPPGRPLCVRRAQRKRSRPRVRACRLKRSVRAGSDDSPAPPGDLPFPSSRSRRWHDATSVVHADARPTLIRVRPAGAIVLADYFVDHARAAFSVVGTDLDTGNAKHVLGTPRTAEPTRVRPPPRRSRAHLGRAARPPPRELFASFASFLDINA